MRTETNKKTEELFARGSVWAAIAKMSIPAVVTMMVMVIYNMADTFFVGKTGDALQVAAISLASPVYMVIMSIGTLVGGGGCAAIAGALGSGNGKAVRAMCGACTVIILAASLLIGGGVILFIDPILGILGTDASTFAYTKSYILVMAVGMVFIVFASSFANIIRSEGAAKSAMVGNAIGTVTNMLLDPLFILAFRMGVAGAAIATVIGNAVASVYYIWYIGKKSGSLTVHPKYVKDSPAAIASVVSLGIPNAVSNLLSGIVNTISNHLLIAYGAATIAAVGVGGKAGMIVSMIVMGICMGSQPVIAYNYGAKNLKRTREAIVKLGVVSVAVGSVLTALCYLCSDTLAGLFLTDELLVSQSAHIMKIQLLMMPLVGIYYVGINFMQGAQKAAAATFLSVFRQFVCYIPAIYLLHGLFGLSGIYWVSVVCDGLSIVLALCLIVRNLKKAGKTSENEKPSEN